MKLVGNNPHAPDSDSHRLKGFLIDYTMKEYKIKSPSKKTRLVWADSFYQAIDIVLALEDYKFTRLEYFNYNKR